MNWKKPQRWSVTMLSSGKGHYKSIELELVVVRHQGNEETLLFRNLELAWTSSELSEDQIVPIISRISGLSVCLT